MSNVLNQLWDNFQFHGSKPTRVNSPALFRANDNARLRLVSVTDALSHVTTVNTYKPGGWPLTMHDENNVLTTLAYAKRLWLNTSKLSVTGGVLTWVMGERLFAILADAAAAADMAGARAGASFTGIGNGMNACPGAYFALAVSGVGVRVAFFCIITLLATGHLSLSRLNEIKNCAHRL